MTKHTEYTAEKVRGSGKDLITIPPVGQPILADRARSATPPGATPSSDADEAGRRPSGALGLYVHAFRRHWPLAICLGIACAMAAMIPVWFLTAEKYTSVALLQISANEQQLVFQTVNRALASNFEIFKSTQQQLVTSDVVLVAALRKDEAAKLPVIQNEDDPVRWLAKNIRIDYPGNAEIMRVSLTSAKPEDAATLVGAVVDAYMSEAVDAERRRQRDRLNDLDHIFTEKETELRSLRTELKQLAEQLGTGDSGALALKQHIALEQYAECRSELSRLRTELQRAKDDLQIKTKWIETLKATPQDSPDQEPAAEADPAVARMTEEMEELDTHMAKIRKQTKEPLLSRLTEEYQQKREQLAKKIAERRGKVKKTHRLNLDPQIAELTTRIEILAKQEIEAAKDLEKQRQKAELFGNSSIDVEMLRSELQYKEKILAPIAEEREKLKVELRTVPRITVFQKAEPPKSPDGKPRLQATAMAGGGSFFGIVFLVLWWDVRKQRINSLSDLSSGLGLTVVGTVPLMPKKVVRAGRSGNRNKRWQYSLDHAVDSIAARLFLRKDSGGIRVAMVSSAMQGEGKTTLSVQLAERLARSGEPTLLVDFDLRRPAIHRIFGAPRGPGVGECLRNEFSLAEVVRPTDTPNLSIITAGKPLVESLGPLSNGVTSSFFEKARAAFTFIVVDGSPILPVIDGLLVSQHADTVIMSVRRDTSEAPQVLRACEKLAAFGSRKYVVVLNGSREEVCPEYTEHVLSARVEPAGAGAPKPETNSEPSQAV